MSRVVRRLQRRGHPVAGERLDGAQAHYRNAKGNALTVHVDFRSADMLQFYQALAQLHDEAPEPEDVKDAFRVLDALAAESWLRKRRWGAERAIAIANVYCLEYHGHLPTDEYNGMVFFFSRPSPTEPGTRVGFTRETLDPTRGQETAFARVIERTGDGQIVKVFEDNVTE
jgi:hypothetical protein